MHVCRNDGKGEHFKIHRSFQIDFTLLQIVCVCIGERTIVF